VPREARELRLIVSRWPHRSAEACWIDKRAGLFVFGVAKACGDTEVVRQRISRRAKDGRGGAFAPFVQEKWHRQREIDNRRRRRDRIGAAQENVTEDVSVFGEVIGAQDPFQWPVAVGGQAKLQAVGLAFLKLVEDRDWKRRSIKVLMQIGVLLEVSALKVKV